MNIVHVVVIGAGLMGRAITSDLIKNSSFEKVTMIDKSKKALTETSQIINNDRLHLSNVDITNDEEIEDPIRSADVLISAVPYYYNLSLTKQCILHHTHFIDLGGNNTVVSQQRDLSKKAKKNQVTIIPDSGLAPGLVSIITRDIVEKNNAVESVHIRVGGLPVHPQPPLNYEIVFSPNGLINEYMEDALVLQNKKIKMKPSMTEREIIEFPEPFGKMEAFITSGGSSTLPYTYQHKINTLDYKTIRYPGHCEKMKILLDLGFGSTKPIAVDTTMIPPRKMLISLLNQSLPKTNEDVVLLKVLSKVKRKNTYMNIQYQLIDYFDKQTGFTAMMRTTGFPVAITADLLARNIITQYGVFCPEEIIPPSLFFDELRKRDIDIKIKETSVENG
ncbi:MAG: saccharopine dehydrogenase C-terminal domain-containing protein [Thermoplasmatota archaeon]